MARTKVPKWGTSGFVEMESAATIGATIGRDLFWPDGSTVTSEQLRAAATPPTQTDFQVTYWRLIEEIPPNVVALALASTTGMYVLTGDGSSATRAIQVVAGELTVDRADGVAGNPILGLADVPDEGGGELQRTAFDDKGRRVGTSAATTDDLAEGEANLYFTDDRVRAVDGTVVRRAAGALGGHRIVRSAGVDLVEYASAADPQHGDDTLGITTGAAGDGLEVVVRTRGPLQFDGWSWTPLEPLYLALDGGMTQAPPDPVDGAVFSQVVGHAESSTTVFLSLQPPIYF